jgi:hypothetical protein
MYVKNKIPHKVLENKTPEEMFLGEKSEFNHLRVFGFPVFVNFPKETRTQLDPSRNNGMFFGYNDTLKAYTIYIAGHRKVDISRNVTFNESANFHQIKTGM